MKYGKDASIIKFTTHIGTVFLTVSCLLFSGCAPRLEQYQIEQARMQQVKTYFAKKMERHEANKKKKEELTRRETSAKFIAAIRDAEHGDTEAQFNLAVMYQNGKGVEKDETKAVAWCIKAAEQGHDRALGYLGVLNLVGQDLSKREKKDAIWYTIAATQGDAEAQYRLGAMYLHGQGVLMNDNTAAKWFYKAAEQGHVDAQAITGSLFRDGRGWHSRDYERAIQWLRKAMSQGSPSALNYLGLMYKDGQGVKQDYAEAALLFRKASDKGLANANNSLGDLYYHGLGVSKDIVEAATWYYKAADQGNDAEAQNNLGGLYYFGEGVRMNYENAYYWYSRAADQGFAKAQTNLCNLYNEVKDYRQSALWCLMAAKQGDAAAQYLLGTKNEYGLGLRQNSDQAQYWYSKAAEQGFELAHSKRVSRSTKYFLNQYLFNGYQEIELGDGNRGCLTCDVIDTGKVNLLENVTTSSLYETPGKPPPLVLYEAPRFMNLQNVYRDSLNDGDEGPKMVRIKGGCFQMGSPAGELDRNKDETQHKVCVKDFAISQYEVTFAEYDAYVQATGKRNPPDNKWGRATKPVMDVDWEEAKAYTQWLSQQTGKKYRLPTEAEWEYAARGGTTTAYYWGMGVGRNNANCSECNSTWAQKTVAPVGAMSPEAWGQQTSPVGSFLPNAFGLYDMLGNVWEWTCSDYKSNYDGSETRCGSSGNPVARGGSWAPSDPRGMVRCAIRIKENTTSRSFYTGFRLVQGHVPL